MIHEYINLWKEEPVVIFGLMHVLFLSLFYLMSTINSWKGDTLDDECNEIIEQLKK